MQNVLCRIRHRKPYMWRVDLHHVLVCRKNGSKTGTTFSTHKWKFPSKKQLFGGTVHNICMLCVFRCADPILLWKWLKMDVGKPKAVWSGRKRCHMSQEIGIKFRVAWHPSFPNSSNNVRRFAEQENPKKPPSRLLKLWSAITRELIALKSQWRLHRIQKAASHFWGMLRVPVTSFGRKTFFQVATIFRGFYSESWGWQKKHVGSKFST